MSRFLWLVTAFPIIVGAVAVALAAVTGERAAAAAYLRWQAPLGVLGLGAAGYVLAMAAWRSFEPGEPLRRVWFLLMGAAGLRVAALLAALASAALYAPGPASAVFLDLGRALNSPAASLVAALGLWAVLGVFTPRGLDRMAPARGRDPVLGGLALLVWRATLIGRGASSWPEWGSLVTGRGIVAAVLMAPLLVEAVLIFRASAALRGGLAGRCWTALAAAVFLSALGEAAGAAIDPGEATILTGYAQSCVWLLASLAYALAPALQVEAIARARGAGGEAA
jgi:hypothetical protein